MSNPDRDDHLVEPLFSALRDTRAPVARRGLRWRIVWVVLALSALIWILWTQAR